MVDVKKEHVGFAQHELTATFVFTALSIRDTRSYCALVANKPCLSIFVQDAVEPQWSHKTKQLGYLCVS